MVFEVRMIRNLSLFAVLLVPSLAGAADLLIHPPQTTLTGPRGSQRLLVLLATAGKSVTDVTRQAKFTSSNTKAATVDEQGIVRAQGDGVATITATLESEKASTRVQV